MRNTAPPLPLVVTFECAARLGSFKLAGAELHVTPSAISQQIKQLEAWLGCQLFQRLVRRVELTEAGAAFYEVASTTLAHYRRAHLTFQHRFTQPVLRLSMIPFVAFEICIPALSEFQQHNPNLELRLETSMSLVDFAHEPVDAAIRFGNGLWPDLEVLPLRSATATLVASPTMLAANPVHRPEDLARHTLIYTRSNPKDWAEAARVMHLDKLPGKAELVMDSYLAAMRAAEQGLGVAIGLLPLIRPWLEAGRLVALAPPVSLQQGHYFVFRKDPHKRAQLLAVYEWLRTCFDRL